MPRSLLKTPSFRKAGTYTFMGLSYLLFFTVAIMGPAMLAAKEASDELTSFCEKESKICDLYDPYDGLSHDPFVQAVSSGFYEATLFRWHALCVFCCCDCSRL